MLNFRLGLAACLLLFPTLAEAGCGAIEPKLFVLDVEASMVAIARPETCSLQLSIVRTAPKELAGAFDIQVTGQPRYGTVSVQGSTLSYHRNARALVHDDVVTLQLTQAGEMVPHGASLFVRTKP